MFQSKPTPNISSNKLFKGVDFSSLNLSPSSKDFKKMKEGEIIFKVGDKSDNLFLIVEGEVKIKVPEKTGASFVIHKNAGEFFGEKELITKSPRNSSAVVVKNATLYKMNPNQLRQLISVNHEVRKNLNASSLIDDEFAEDFNNDEKDFSDISDLDVNNIENYNDEYFDAEQIKAEVEKDFSSNDPDNLKEEDIDFSFEDNENNIIEDEFVEDKTNLENENDLNNINNGVENNLNHNEKETNEIEEAEKSAAEPESKISDKLTEESKMIEESKNEFNINEEASHNENDSSTTNENVSSTKEIIKFLTENIKSSNEIISNYLNILRKKEMPSDIKILLDEIFHQNSIAQNYIEAVSDFSENKNNLNTKAAGINETLNDILEKLAEYSEMRKVELFKKLGDDASVNLDKNNFYQACYQIVKNSCDAANTDGKIYITSNKNNNEIVLEFKDNGIGIPESVKENIFEPYVSHGKNGSGLGLALSKKIINDHGGKINAESVLGEGTTITISLPLSPD